jgi:hypothetical protein
VTPLDVSAYAQLRASVRALIDGYEQVAAMFTSPSAQLADSSSTPERTGSS